MKILTNLGIVAGIHAIVLLVIFASPGCSSSKGQSSAAETPVKADLTPAAPSITAAPEAAAPLTPAADASGPGTILYSPTRPGTPAAEALEAQPVSGVVPASTYTVAANDSLWSVAKKNHMKISDLAAANNLKSGATLHVGQKLVIPSKAGSAPVAESAPVAAMAAPSPKPPGESVKYTVRSGETLGAIARKFHVKVGAIAEANAISDPRKIHAGQELTIPGGKAGAAGKTAPAGAAKPVEEAPAEAATPPPATQDLDAGLKPVAPSEVPVMKVDDSSPAAPKKP
jgi:LysM repeat protein